MGTDRIRRADTKEHRVIKQLPWSETCFGCNGGPNEGIGLRLAVTEDGYVVCVYQTKNCHQGFPGFVHGGIIASYFDEVLWGQTLIQDLDVSAMTVEMNIQYLAPVETGQEIRVIARPAKIEGRHIYVDGFLLLPDDTIAAKGHAHYIAVKKTNVLSENEEERVKHMPEVPLTSVRF